MKDKLQNALIACIETVRWARRSEPINSKTLERFFFTSQPN